MNKMIEEITQSQKEILMGFFQKKLQVSFENQIIDTNNDQVRGDGMALAMLQHAQHFFSDFAARKGTMVQISNKTLNIKS